MGTKMASSFACMFVGKLEEILYQADSNPFFSSIISWKRYIDDIFLLWEASVSALLDFLSFLNSNFLGLKFTMNYSRDENQFLDINVKRMGTILTSSLYTKPRNTLLHAKSYHSVALKKGLPIRQLTRIKRICEDDDEERET